MTQARGSTKTQFARFQLEHNLNLNLLILHLTGTAMSLQESLILHYNALFDVGEAMPKAPQIWGTEFVTLS
jgi:hypothetical protein